MSEPAPEPFQRMGLSTVDELVSSIYANTIAHSLQEVPTLMAVNRREREAEGWVYPSEEEWVSYHAKRHEWQGAVRTHWDSLTRSQGGILGQLYREHKEVRPGDGRFGYCGTCAGDDYGPPSWPCPVASTLLGEDAPVQPDWPRKRLDPAKAAAYKEKSKTIRLTKIRSVSPGAIERDGHILIPKSDFEDVQTGNVGDVEP